MLITIITWLYGFYGFAVIVMDLPQIRTAWTDTTGCRALSLTSWTFWTSSYVVMALYAIIVAHNILFAVISLVDLSATLMVLVIAMIRRWQVFQSLIIPK